MTTFGDLVYQLGGIPTIGGGQIPFSTGSYFFVDSVNGNAGNTGKTPTAALATIDQAIGKCTANKGDVIIVLPGHTETISTAAGISLDVAGVTIIGLGNMTLKPTITFDAAAADINVSAINCRISNLRLVSDVNDLVSFLDLDAGQFITDHVDMVTSSAKEALTFVDIATTFDDFLFSDCTFVQPTDPAGTDGAAGTGAIFCVDSERITVERCKFKGNFETAIIHNRTTKCLDLNLLDCIFDQRLATGLILQLVAASEGNARNCVGEARNATDATLALVWGVVGVNFWISPTCGIGNDSAAGGQGGIIEATAS